MRDGLFDAARRISAADVAQRAGISLTRRGSKQWACCPLHGEKTASMCFYPGGTWYCFGCHRGGDATALYAALYGLSAKDAASNLLAEYGITAAPRSAKQVRQMQQERAAQAQRQADEARAYDLLCWAERYLRDPQPPPKCWEDITHGHMTLIGLRDEITGILDAQAGIPAQAWKVVMAVAGARDKLGCTQ